MKTTQQYWEAIAQKHQQELEGMTPSELQELSLIVMSAIDEELHYPHDLSFRMTWCINTLEPSENVLNLTKKLGFRFVEGNTYSYIEWIRFLTREA